MSDNEYAKMWKAGYEAMLSGLKVKDNPYPFSPRDPYPYENWLAGWRSAFLQYCDISKTFEENHGVSSK